MNHNILVIGKYLAENILLSALKHNTTVNKTYYAFLLYKLRDHTRVKFGGKLTKVVNNHTIHSVAISQDAIRKCGFRPPPFTLNIVPSNYYLFFYLNNDFKLHHFTDNKEKQAVVI